jgi:hypothetical protein
MAYLKEAVLGNMTSNFPSVLVLTKHLGGYLALYLSQSTD